MRRLLKVSRLLHRLRRQMMTAKNLSSAPCPLGRRRGALEIGGARGIDPCRERARLDHDTDHDTVRAESRTGDDEGDERDTMRAVP